MITTPLYFWNEDSPSSLITSSISTTSSVPMTEVSSVHESTTVSTTASTTACVPKKINKKIDVRELNKILCQK